MQFQFGGCTTNRAMLFLFCNLIIAIEWTFSLPYHSISMPQFRGNPRLTAKIPAQKTANKLKMESSSMKTNNNAFRQKIQPKNVLSIDNSLAKNSNKQNSPPIVVPFMDCRSANKITEPLIVIGGPTGSGKSAFGIEIAKKFGGEIISADSMQIYKGLDIATNKVTDEEMDDVPHHLMSFLEWNAHYDASDFLLDALKTIDDIWRRGKVPILVGGSSGFIRSVLFCNDAKLVEEEPRFEQGEIHKRLQKKFPTSEQLYAELIRVDTDAAADIFEYNSEEVIKAIELFELTGKTKKMREQGEKDAWSLQTSSPRFKNSLVFVLDVDFDMHKATLDDRIHKMIEKGLLQEFTQFYKKHAHSPPVGLMQCIGINAFLPYLRLRDKASAMGDRLLNESIERFKNGDLEYSKYQRRCFTKGIIEPFKINKQMAKQLVSINVSHHKQGDILRYAFNLVENQLFTFYSV